MSRGGSRFRSRPASLDDAAVMRVHLRTELTVDAAPLRCFEVLATGEDQRDWAPGYRRTVWRTAPGPDGIREVHLRWVTVTERFLAWEPGRRFAFSSDAMSLPLVSEMIEDITFAPAPGGRTLLVWSVHLTPRRWLAPVEGLLVRRVFDPMFATFAAGLARQASAPGVRP